LENEQYYLDRIQELEKQVTQKDEFIYLIVHDLKTPLAVIASALQTLDLVCKHEMPDKAKKFLNTIKQNINRQIRLVNNLLDITRLHAGHIKLSNRNCDIVSTTQYIVNSVQTYAQQKNITLKFKAMFPSKTTFIDEEKYERSLLNLLSNAIKFTPSGKSINVSITTKIHKQAELLSVSIKDEGIGIPKDKQSIIFERFGQSDTELSRHAEGTGLGLHLVKLFVNALGGEINLKSEEGKGSNFILYLPLVQSDVPDEITEYHQMRNQPFNHNNRILEAAAIEFSDTHY